MGPRAEDEPFARWLDRVAAGRRRQDLLGVSHDDDLDVEDPVGRGRADYESTASLLDELIGRFVDLAVAGGHT